jgi:hypothetical protein
MPIVFGLFPILPRRHHPSLFVMIIGILPALKAEAFSTDPAGLISNGWAMTAAKSPVVNSFTRGCGVHVGADAPNPALTVLRRTTF